MYRSYSIYYGLLTIFLSSCIPAFSQNLKSTIQKWKNEETLSGTNPGLVFIPTPDNKESTLIWSKERNYEEFKSNIMNSLDVYYNPHNLEKENVTLKQCSYNDLPTQGQVCDVDVRYWEPCSRENYFGYHRASPCIFLKLHTADGWVPEYYNDTYDLPEDMPMHLKEYINTIGRPEERNKVWISCFGEYPVDVEFLGSVHYYPYPGFPGYYYPHKNKKGYLSPLVAVQFKRPRMGVVVNIECRAWAKNIKYNKTDRTGSVHFELLLD